MSRTAAGNKQFFFVSLLSLAPPPSFSCLTSVQLLCGCIPSFSKFITHRITLSQSVRYRIICFILICSGYPFLYFKYNTWTF